MFPVTAPPLGGRRTLQVVVSTPASLQPAVSPGRRGPSSGSGSSWETESEVHCLLNFSI